MRTPAGSPTKRAVKKILLVDGFQHLRRPFLEGSIEDRGNANGALFGFARFEYPHSPNGRWMIPWGMDLPQGLLCPPVHVCGDLGHGVSIDSRCTGLLHVAEMVSQPVGGDRVHERGKGELRFPASFRCYPFQCCCHGIRPSWLCVQHVFPHGVGTVLPFPGACSADPFPLYAALPRSAYYGSARLPTARPERLALRTLVSPLPIQHVGCIGSRRISQGHEGSFVCVLWVCTPEEPA
jgi:hypothetical protein